MNHAIYVCETTVIDPHTNAPVDVAIYKDIQSSGIFGIDSSYLLTLSDEDPVSNPFNGNDIKLIDSPESCLFYLADIRYKDDRVDLGGLVFCSLDSLPDDSPYTEDEVFYFGMGHEEARLSINQQNAVNDFVITRVQSLNLDVIAEPVKSFEQQIDPVVYSTINEQAWHQSINMVMSEVPPLSQYGTGRPGSYDNPCNEFMDSDRSGEWPDGFVAWQPFENWELCGLQEIVEEFHDSLMCFARKNLASAGVINNE